MEGKAEGEKKQCTQMEENLLVKLFSPDADKVYAYHVRDGYKISHHGNSSDKLYIDLDQVGDLNEKVLEIEYPW